MKKSLIALTLAALPVAAMADVTLYGQIKAGVEVSKVKLGEQTAAKLGHEKSSKTATEIADFGSRIGFKGHEHLGNNLNAIWQVEQNTSIAGGDKEWASRESFIGLEGGFGKVRAGKLDSTVKNTSDNVDQWESSNGALNMSVFTRVDERAVSVRYDSPVFSGFSASVQYIPRDNANPSDKYTHNDATRDTYYAGLNYENSGFFGQYAGGFRKNAVSEKDGHVHRLVGGYDANNLFVSVAGQYAKNWETLGDYAEAQSNGVVTSAMRAAGTNASNVVFGTAAGLDSRPAETIEVAATAAYRAGNVTPRVSYAHGFKAKVDGEKLKGTQYDQVIVGADYDFSKRTTALVSAGWLRGAESGPHKVETISGLVGLRHKF
ncbi:Gram-negative porin [Neisseria flavescens]|mgnify:FL=1|uniref:trimeric porin PorB n=1 Tax=Neisseria flavescens TaxID=484 RepID=UPI0007A5AB37|nr:trimeric porin PorB [Neisseria flavescens]KZC85581.1 Gram-negative porin [Neisseria flavescens]